MCMEEYGFLRSRHEEITRIYNEWDFDGAALRAATYQFMAMGDIGPRIAIAVLTLQLEEKEKSSVRIHVRANVLRVTPC